MRAVLAIALAGCYSPSLIDGQMCSETAHCPEGLSCDPNTNTCVHHVVHCTQWSDFAAPTKLTNLSVATHNLYTPWLSPDGLELWYMDDVAAPHLWRSRRQPGEEFPAGEPVAEPPDIAPINGQPFISDDLLTLYYNDPSLAVFERKRATALDEFATTGERVFPTMPFSDPAGTADGLELVVAFPVTSSAADLELSTRASIEDRWSAASADVFTATNSTDDDCCATISGDGTEVIFESQRQGGQSLWRTTRATRADAFGPADRLVGQPDQAANASPTLSRDGTTLVYSSKPNGQATYDLVLGERTCLHSD